MQLSSSSNSERAPNWLENLDGDPTKRGFKVEKVHPKAEQPKAPQDTPSDIGQDFLEALDSLRRRKFNSAGMMFRRVLDRATLKISDEPETMKKKKLYARIEALESEQKLTPAMKDLAHVIRDEGNDAAHEDEEFDEPRAKQLKEFTELLLIYAFTLPERVRRVQGEAAAD